MAKLVKPVFPMSDEEHDKYVDLAWKNGKMSIQEQKVREIIDKEVMQYSTGVMVAPTNIDPFIQKIGVHFRFNDELEVNVQMCFNMTLGTLYSIKSQKFVNGEEDEFELNYADDKGGLERLNQDLLEYAGVNKIKDCDYCTDGWGKFSLLKSGLSWQLGENVPQNADVTGLVIADIDVYISDNDEGNNLELLVTNANNDPIIKEIAKIKYCPYCGRELGGK